MTWTIPIALLFLGILVLWFIVGCRGNWLLKLICLMLIVVFAWQVSQAINSYKGYCMNEAWENLSGTKALLVSYRVREPTLQLNDPGEIFLWIIPFKIDTTYFAYHPLREEPRAYSLPYIKSAQKSLSSLKKSQEGTALIEFGVNQSHGKNGIDNSGSMSIGAGEIYQLPPPKLPEKSE